ncbi:MAG: ABC transporter permease [Bacteroidales bacterium]|nr:ABC transporter permease [Bacteroidales bacterium]
MKASRFISERLDFRGRITVVATAVSFLVIIIAVAVVDGFRMEIRNGVSTIMGDVQLTSPGANYFGEGEPVSESGFSIDDLRELNGVKDVVPAIYRTGIVRNGTDIQGVLFKGVPSADSAALGVSIPATLADRLDLKEGDPLLTYFVGESVKVRKFTVRSVYRDLLRTDDNIVVYASIPDLQRVNGWSEGEYSALEVLLEDRWRSYDGENRKAAEASVLSGLSAQTAYSRFSHLFDWLNLLDFNVLAILLLMILVAGFNMVSGLLIMLFRHTGTIGTLKAVGMDNRGIAGVFLRVASRVVLLGMAIGNALALLFCLVQGTTHLLRLNPENYFVSYVPVWVNVPKILLADAVAYLAIMLLMLLPSLFIARVDPADTVRVK